MNKTQELIQRIIGMLKNGKLKAKDVPATDVRDCVLAELKLYKSTFLDEQYKEILRIYNDLCSRINDIDGDKGKCLLFLEGTLLCLQTISGAVLSLADRRYWEKWHRDELGDPEIDEIIDYIARKKDIRLLNYDFVDRYMQMDFDMVYDSEHDMRYIPYKGRRMYFPSAWHEDRIIDYFRNLVSEQDDYSPHCYRKNGYEVLRGDVILDIGAAEGIFALDHLDEAGYIYLVEADEEWVKALKQTFHNDGDKVKIIYGRVCRKTEGEIDVSIDDMFRDVEINYIKMDIEGYEKDALEGADRLFSESKRLTCAICSYHEQDAEEWITTYLQEKGYSTEHSRGYICPDWCLEGRLEAQLRRGIVFGKKRK